MINLMKCPGKKLREYGFEMEEKHEYEICRFSAKNIYSYSQSQQVIRNLKHCKTRNHNKVYLRAYKCKRCNGWHLTSEKPFQYREERWITYENKRVGQKTTSFDDNCFDFLSSLGKYRSLLIKTNFWR